MIYKLKNPTEYDIELCDLFSSNCVKTNADEYASRGQCDIEKIKRDIYYGKIAEIMVYNLLMDKDKRPYPIDFLIYDRGKKSFDADMRTDKHFIHVKSCMDSSAFPNSWLFQPNDMLVINPRNNDLLFLVVISKESYCYIRFANNVIYGNPIKKTLNKKVIYEKTLNKS